MPKVICTLPNASELISGVRFVSHKLGMISEEIEEDVAAAFTAIRGYVLADKKGQAKTPPEPVTPPSTPAAVPDGADETNPDGATTNPPAADAPTAS